MSPFSWTACSNAQPLSWLGETRSRCMGALLDIIGQPVWPELFGMFVLFADFLQNLTQPRSFSSAGDCQCYVCSRSFESLVGLQFIGGLLFSWNSDMRELFSSNRDLNFYFRFRWWGLETANYRSRHVRQDSSLHPPPPLLACWRMKTHRSIIGLAMMRRGAQHWSAVALLWRMVGWPPTRDGSQSSVSSLAEQSLRKRYSPILRSGFFLSNYTLFSSIAISPTLKWWWICQSLRQYLTPTTTKMTIYCPQGSGTLRQQLLMMHGIEW